MLLPMQSCPQLLYPKVLERTDDRSAITPSDGAEPGMWKCEKQYRLALEHSAACGIHTTPLCRSVAVKRALWQPVSTMIGVPCVAGWAARQSINSSPLAIGIVCEIRDNQIRFLGRG